MVNQLFNGTVKAAQVASSASSATTYAPVCLSFLPFLLKVEKRFDLRFKS